MIKVREIHSRHDKKKFFKFLIDLYKDNKYAVPNLYMDEFGEFNPKVNDAFRFADCRMFLAYKNGKIVGRIAGIWHRGANEKAGVKQLRFTRFDVIDDFEVTKALFDKLFEWAKELGMEEIIGPISFSDLNEEGMLIDGFDKPSTYMEIYNYPYYVTHMEKLGAYKIVDWTCFRMPVPKQVNEHLLSLSDKVAKANGYTVLDAEYYLKHDKKKLSEYIMQCLDILDEAYAPLYGTSPLSEKQKKREMKVIYQALIPDFAAVILKDNKVIAYGFLMPSMNKVLQKGKGHVLPFALFEYIRAFKHVEVADMMSIGVAKEHNNKGAVAMILAHCWKGLIKHNVKFVEGGPQLDNNNHIQNLWKKYDHEVAKRRRCWGLKVDKD